MTTTVCETDAEFVQQLRELAAWNAERGYGPMKIDAGFDDGLRQAFETLGPMHRWRDRWSPIPVG